MVDTAYMRFIPSYRIPSALCQVCSTLLVFLVVSCISSVQAQENQSSHPDRSGESVALFHYPPETGVLRPQIWQIAYWSESIVAAQEGGISVLLGDSWRFVETPSKTTVRSFAASQDGSLYFGDQGSIGRLTWVDNEVVVEKLPIPDSLSGNLGDVWGTYAPDSTVVFQTRNHILVYTQDAQRVYYSSNGFHNSFLYRGKVYVKEFGTGLFRLDVSGLTLLRGGLGLKDMVFGITDHYGAGQVWTQSGQLYGIDGDSLVSMGRVSDELVEIAEDVRLYTIARIDSSYFVVGSLGQGAIIVDRWGGVVARFGAEAGMSDDFINHVLVGANGQIWFALNNEGVARMDVAPTKTRYSRQHGLWGHIYNIGEIDSELVIATGSRLSVMDESTRLNAAYSSNPSRSYFRQVPNTNLAWDFVQDAGGTVVGSESGAILLSERESKQTECEPQLGSGSDVTQSGPMTLMVLSFTTTHSALLAGTSRGVFRVETGTDAESGDPSCTLYPVETGVELTSVVKHVETDGDVVWVVTDDGELFSGSYQDGTLPLTEYPYLADTGNRVEPLKITVGEATFVAQGHRLFRIHSPGLPPVELTDAWNAAHEEIEDIHADRENGIWMSTTGRIVHFMPDGLMHTYPALEVPKGESAQMYVDKKGKLWYTDGDALVRFDPEAARVRSDSTSRRAQVFIQGVSPLGDNGGFDGEHMPPAEKQFYFGQHTYDIGIFEYDFNSIKLTLGATGAEYLGSVYYSYDANDGEGWHEWTTDNQVELPSLSAGMHTISVRSRDDWGSISEPVHLKLHILPPWYATWWAMLLYIWGGLALAYIGGRFVHMRREHRKAKEQKQELARNRVVMKKLEEANESLVEANRMKDEFLATTSHELRTPMTAILGFTSILKEEIPPDAEYREFLDIIEESGGRLMDTLTSLLDLARLRAGNMDITPEPVNLSEAAHAAASRFEDQARTKGLTLAVDAAPDALVAQLDTYATGRALDILLSNAIKFTEEGEVCIGILRDVNRDTGATEAIVEVRDTGIGMDATFMETLFEAYTQESVGLSRSHEGQGLGLAICAGLVDLMGGTISVRSKKGEGSIFCLIFPVDTPTSAASAPRTDRPARPSERPSSDRRPQPRSQADRRHTDRVS